MIQEEINILKKKQVWFAVVMAMSNLLIVIGMVVYYTYKQQALVGALYLRESSSAEKLLNIIFQLHINETNLSAARDAMWQAGYTEYGFRNLFRTSGEMWILLGIIAFIVILFVVSLRHTLLLGKKDRLGKILELEKDYENMKLYLVQEREYNAKQKKELQDFIENIAHQVKTPLAALTVKLGLMQELEETQDCPQKGKVLEDCFYNVFKIKAFITRLLNISRLESGKVIMTEDEIVLADLLQESINGCGIKEHQILMNNQADRVSIYADEGWLMEAFVNLISNCEEFIREKPEGRVYIDLRKEGDYISVVIADNGKGIREGDIPHIFNRFETTRESRDFHVGIGLNLAKLVIEAHHGKIHAGNSEEYGGAEFRILLPVYHMKMKYRG